jgi:two-component system copper resistance phosphate regulon response regulator CusR
VDLARDGVDGLHLALEGDYAVIVLDVMLPGLDGFGVLRALRARKQTPVIMLTARERVEDRIMACAKAPTITWASRSPSLNWWPACKP